MGLLERMGLVEKEQVAFAVDYPVDVEPTEEVEAQVDSAENIVDSIYEQNEMSNKNDSIYTVQALIATLPAEMTTAKKQATVAGILAVSGKNVATLLADAEGRKAVLSAACNKVVQERNEEIATANSDIETLKQAIEAATIQIKSAEDIIAATQQGVADELKVIDSLVEFCNGMGV